MYLSIYLFNLSLSRQLIAFHMFSSQKGHISFMFIGEELSWKLNIILGGKLYIKLKGIYILVCFFSVSAFRGMIKIQRYFFSGPMCSCKKKNWSKLWKRKKDKNAEDVTRGFYSRQIVYLTSKVSSLQMKLLVQTYIVLFIICSWFEGVSFPKWLWFNSFFRWSVARSLFAYHPSACLLFVGLLKLHASY
jgi:hypothetical protein